ncbi:MAG: hypothetical protein ACJ8DC_09450 [Gemmatimonadales bacterium]
MGERPESKGGLGATLKWVGGATAVLSLVFGLRQLTMLISDARDRQRQTTELIAVAKLQQEGRDYQSGWISLRKAAELRANQSRVGAAQEDLAMIWLDNIRGSQSRTPFTAIVDTVVPVLSRGVLSARGTRKADLLAHLGWADFLRWRDGDRSLEPAERYHYSRLVSASDEDSIDQLFASVPPAEQVATYRWAFRNTAYVTSKGLLYECGGPTGGGARDLPIGSSEAHLRRHPSDSPSSRLGHRAAHKDARWPDLHPLSGGEH